MALDPPMPLTGHNTVHFYLKESSIAVLSENFNFVNFTAYLVCKFVYVLLNICLNLNSLLNSI